MNGGRETERLLYGKTEIKIWSSRDKLCSVDIGVSCRMCCAARYYFRINIKVRFITGQSKKGLI